MTAPKIASVAAAEQSAQLTLANGARAVQLAIRARLMTDVVKLWPLLDAKRLNQTWPGWLRAMSVLITSYHGQSAQAASTYYRHARSEATQSPSPKSLIKLAPKPADEWLTRALGYSGPGMLSRDTVRPGTALSTTLGTAARVTLDGGRTTILDTVQSDPVAVAWYRVTDGHPCAFCALLAARGMVYKKDTVGFQAHNDCGCFGAPAFTHDQELPELSRTAAQIYVERGSGDAMTAFRKAWAEHQAQSA